MKSAKVYLVGGLALVAVGSSILAWRQYVELVGWRAAALSPGGRGDFERRITEMGQRNRELENQIAALRDRAAGEMSADDSGERRSEAVRVGRGGRGDPAAMRALMDNPQMQALRSLQQRGELDARYGALFKNLKLSPEQLEKFKTLLAERQATVMDVMAAAREQGLDLRQNPDELRKLVTAAQTEVNNSIKAVLGDEGFAQYQTYEQTAPQRNVVGQLEQRLSYTDTPLTAAQSEQLLNILAASPTTPATMGVAVTTIGTGPGGADAGGVITRGPSGASAIITPEVVAQAQPVLSATQLAALQQLQQQQQAQQQLQQAIRNSSPQTSGGGTTSPGGGRRGGGGD